MERLPSLTKGGLFRRSLALLIDLIVVQCLVQLIAIPAFSISHGALIDSNSYYTTCETTSERPDNLELPAGAEIKSSSICTSGLFGFKAARLFVITRHDAKSPVNISVKYALDEQNRIKQAFDLAAVQGIVLVLMRWALARRGWRSPGYRLLALRIVPYRAEFRDDELPAIARRRFLAFGLPLIPDLVLAVALYLIGAALGPLSGETASVLSFFAKLPISVAAIAAVSAILRRRDTFYDVHADTTVARIVAGGVEVAAEPSAGRGRSWWGSSLESRQAWHFAFPWVSVGITAILIVVFGAELFTSYRVYHADTVAGPVWVIFGAMDGELVWRVGQWYRLATSIFLHASALHLLANATVLLLAGALLEGYLGRGWFLASFVLGGLAASLWSVLSNAPSTLSMGASGAVTAVLAAGFVASIRLEDQAPRLWVRAFCLACLLASIQATGTFSFGAVDRAAHLGGAVGGVLVGLLTLLSWPRASRMPKGQRAAAAMALALGAALFVSITRTGFGDPPIMALMVPNDKLPKTDHDWIAASADLVRLYPEDPRVHLARAVAVGNDAAEREHQLSLALDDQRRFGLPDETPSFAQHAFLTVAGARSEAGDWEASRDLFTRAIMTTAPDMPEAFEGRARVEASLGLEQDAILDLRRALSLGGKPVGLDIELADALFSSGQLAQAVSAMNAALALEPDNELAVRGRGWVEFYNNRPDDSVRDLETAVRLKPDDPYAAIWLKIVATRVGRPDHFDEQISSLPMDRWPAPVVRLYAGEGDPLDLFQAAGDADPKKEKEQRCEVSFYYGELLIMRQNDLEARTYLDDAARTCPETFYEKAAVKAELRRAAGLRAE